MLPSNSRYTEGVQGGKRMGRRQRLAIIGLGVIFCAWSLYSAGHFHLGRNAGSLESAARVSGMFVGPIAGMLLAFGATGRFRSK
jgi:hypothetical protein